MFRLLPLHLVIPQVSTLLCHSPALVEAICQQAPATASQVLEIVSEVIEPFDTLRESLEVVACLDGSVVQAVTREAVSQLLPGFHVALLCSRGQVLKSMREACGFRPLIVPFPPARQPFTGILCSVGDCSFCEAFALFSLDRLHRLQYEDLDNWTLPDDYGFCAFIPAAPLKGPVFWQPSASSLRSTRLHVQWMQRAASALAAFHQAASNGCPAAVLFQGLEVSELGTFGEGLLASGARCVPFPSSLLFVSP